MSDWGKDRPGLAGGRNPHPQVQRSRRHQLPNRDDVLADLDEEQLVAVVMETFRFQAKIRGEPEAVFTAPECVRRARMAKELYLEHRFDCGQSSSEALQVTQARLLWQLFRVGDEPDVSVYREGVRVDSAAPRRPRSMRAVPQSSAPEVTVREQDAVNAARIIVTK